MTHNSESTPHNLPSVHILEVTAISLGAIGLLGAAIMGLVNKIVTNMNQPERVEKVAQHLIRYKFPGSSTGKIGLSIGGESFSVITDRPENPSLRLFVQASPVNQVERTSIIVRESALEAVWNGTWTTVTQTDQPFKYCNQAVNLEVNRGLWSIDRDNEAVNAIEYTLDVTVDNYDQTIRILSTGINAEIQAKQLLETIQCRKIKKK